MWEKHEGPIFLSSRQNIVNPEHLPYLKSLYFCGRYKKYDNGKENLSTVDRYYQTRSISLKEQMLFMVYFLQYFDILWGRCQNERSNKHHLRKVENITTRKFLMLIERSSQLDRQMPITYVVLRSLLRGFKKLAVATDIYLLLKGEGIFIEISKRRFLISVKFYKGVLDDSTEFVKFIKFISFFSYTDIFAKNQTHF